MSQEIHISALNTKFLKDFLYKKNHNPLKSTPLSLSNFYLVHTISINPKIISAKTKEFRIFSRDEFQIQGTSSSINLVKPKWISWVTTKEDTIDGGCFNWCGVFKYKDAKELIVVQIVWEQFYEVFFILHLSLHYQRAKVC